MGTEQTEREANDTISVRLHGLAVGGAMVGRVTAPAEDTRVGMAAFVPFAAPGETVEASVLQAHARHLDAELVTITEPSPERVTPRCPYFTRCGGCDIQHLYYEAQLSAKQEMIHGAFRTGGFDDAALARIAPITPGPPYAYRRRITLHVDAAGRLGYYARRSRMLLPVTTCPISVPAIDEFLAQGFTLEGLLPAGATGGELIVEAGENGLFGVLRLSVPPTSAALREHLASVFAGGAIDVNGLVGNRFGEPNLRWQEEAVVPGLFSQVNTTINTALVAKILTIAENAKAERALDLYAGAGNFALPLAAKGLTTTAVEYESELVRVGREETARRGLTAQLTFLETPVEQFLAKKRGTLNDLIIADPPRAGLGKLAAQMPLAPHLVLISCHLPSAVRDVRTLQKAGWRVAEIVPHDMFAQTGHVEVLTYLRYENEESQ
jgi:23S rRNA (uracil1939-C5)-methyltransferase